MSGFTVMLISDVHSRYEVINQQIRHAEKNCEHLLGQVMVLGDFGFFDDELSRYFRREKRRFLRPVATIEGNHEDHGALSVLAERYADVVSYKPRGSVQRLGEWNGLCLGGVRYMDAGTTPRGSVLGDDEVDACLDRDPDEVDLLLTHDCPAGIGVPNTPGFTHYGAPGVPGLTRLAGHFRPRWWFFGHHHRWFYLHRDGTRYVGLPQSWCGYVLLHADGEISMVNNAVVVESQPWWKRLFG